MEQAILNLGIAAEAAVKPIEKNGREYLAAWLVLKDKRSSAEPQKIRLMLKKSLREEEIPRQIFFLDSLPVNESGKVLKRALQAVDA